jgi:autotransporter-associated beta strand protein
MASTTNRHGLFASSILPGSLRSIAWAAAFAALVLAAGAAQAQISVVNDSGAPTGTWIGYPNQTAYSFSNNFTVTGGDMLVVDLEQRNAGGSESLTVKWGSSTLNLAYQQNSSNTSHEYGDIYYLPIGTTGTNALTVSFDSGTYEYAVEAYTLSGVDTTKAPICNGTDVTSGSGLNSVAVTVPTAGSFAAIVNPVRSNGTVQTETFAGPAPSTAATSFNIWSNAGGGLGTTQFNAGYLNAVPNGSDTFTSTMGSGFATGNNRNEIAVAVFTPLTAVGDIWAGGTAGFVTDWNTAGNWSAGVPAASTTITLGNAGAQNAVNLSAAGTVGNIVLLSAVPTTVTGSALTIDNGGTTATVTSDAAQAISTAISLNDNTNFKINSGTLTLGGQVSNGSNGAKGISLDATSAGTLALTATNNYTGGTSVNGGTLSLGIAGAINRGTIAVNGGNLTQTVANAISNTASLAVSGGKATLSQVNSYSGGTTVSGTGTLLATNASGAADGSAGVTVNSGGTVGGSGVLATVNVNSGGILAPQPGSGTSYAHLSVGNLSVADGGIMDFNLGPSGTNDYVIVTGTLTLAGSETINVAFPAGLQNGTYQIIQPGPTPSDTATITVSGTPTESYKLLKPGAPGNSTSWYEIQTSINSFTWTGANNFNWDLITPNNWTGTAGTTYTDGLPVIFNDSGNASSPIVISGTVRPYSVTFNNSSETYTIGTGVIGNVSGGTTPLTMNGPGTVILTGANTYTGGTTINGGILSATNLQNYNTASSIGEGATGNPASSLALNGGTLQYSGSTAASTNRNYTVTSNGGALDASGSVAAATLTINGNLTGSTTGTTPLTLTGTNTAVNNVNGTIADGTGGATSLIKTGTGFWELTGNNAFTGGVWIKNGTLYANGSSSLSGAGASVLGENSSATAIQLGDTAGGNSATLEITGGYGGINLNQSMTVNSGSLGTKTLLYVNGGNNGAPWTGGITMNDNLTVLLNTTGGPLQISGPISGSGNLVVSSTGSSGAGTLVLSDTANSYTGQTSILAGTVQLGIGSGYSTISASGGVLGIPGTGNTTILLGDTAGSANVTLSTQWDGRVIVDATRPILVQSGSIGSVTITSQPNAGSYTINSTITLEKDLTLTPVSGGITINGQILAGPSSSGNLVQTGGNANTMYGNAIAPQNINTIIDSNVIQWEPGNLAGGIDATTMPTAAFGTGSINLSGGAFEFLVQDKSASGGTDPVSLTTPVNVTGTGNGLYGWEGKTGSGTANITFIGPINLAGALTIGSRSGQANFNGTNYNANGSAMNYAGTVTIDQSTPGLREIIYNAASTTAVLASTIVDGAGSANNPLVFGITSASMAQITGNSPYAGRSVFLAGPAGGYWDVTGTAVLGTGNVVLFPGAAVRLNSASNLGAGATVSMPGSPALAPAILALASTSINPTSILTSSSGGILGIDTTYSTALNMANVGNGMMYLGSIAGGTYSAATLGPNTDGNYRLGGGGGTLTISTANVLTNALTGSRNLIVGQVGGYDVNGNATLGAQGNVKLTASQNLTGTVTVNGGWTGLEGSQAATTTLEMAVSAGVQPLSGTSNNVFLNGGNLQFDMPTSGGAGGNVSTGDLNVTGGPSTLTAYNANTYANTITIGGPKGIVRNNNAGLYLSSNNGMNQFGATPGTQVLVTNNSLNGNIPMNAATAIGNVTPAGNTATNGMATYGGVPAPWIQYWQNQAGGQFMAYTTNGFVPTTYTVGGTAVHQVTDATGYYMINTVASDIVDFAVSGNDASLTADQTIFAMRTTKTSRQAAIVAGGASPINLIITSGALNADEQNGTMQIGQEVPATGTQAVNLQLGDGTTVEGVINVSAYNGNDNLMLNNGVTAASITKMGAGTLMLTETTGTNSIPGPITIDAGVVQTGDIYNNNRNGAGTEFALGPGTGNNYVVLNGGEWLVNYDVSGTITHNIEMGPAGGVFNVGQNGSWTSQAKTYSGSISDLTTGAGPLTLVTTEIGGGFTTALTFTNTDPTANLWSGGTVIENNGGGTGIVTVANDVNFGTGDVNVISGTLNLQGNSNLGANAMLTVGQAATTSFQSATPAVGGIQGAGSLVLGTTSQATVLSTGANNANSVFEGVISEAAAGAGSLTKVGTGTLTLLGANTYTGTTTVNGGTVSVSTDQNLGIGGRIVLNGGALSASLTFTLNAARGIALGPTAGTSGSGTLDVAPGAILTYNGTISNNGSPSDTDSLIKTGAGELKLGGTGTYTGITSVEDGLLVIDSSEAIPSGSTVATTPNAAIVLGDPSLPSDGTSLGGLVPGSGGGLAASPNVVPEPGALALLLAAAAACALAVWRKRR